VDYRGLDKFISNEGWQIPNMPEMLMRIGHKTHNVSLTLHQDFFKCLYLKIAEDSPLLSCSVEFLNGFVCP